jgi:hypothetical protein
MGDGARLAEASARMSDRSGGQDPSYEQVKALFHAALEQPVGSRAEWLLDMAAGDNRLLQEVASLLRAHDTAGAFLEQPAELELEDPEPGFAAGTRIGPYLIVEEIARGGMGIVYLAEDIRLGRRVALKSLPQAVASDAHLRDRLRREARAAATIAHPGIATVYALEELDDQIFLATEYVPGRTLRQEIDNSPLPLERACDIATDIVRALAAAHEAGVVHRDLKPENVIVTHTGSIKVVDFGIAYTDGFGQTRHTRDGAIIGTPAYMAPEQLTGERGDARTDLYAAGLVLAEMLTGHHPLSPAHRAAAIPTHLRAVIDKCLNQDPAGRYASGRELLRALDSAAQHDRLNAEIASGRAMVRSTARWWWEFHLGVAALLYWLMVIPAWTARTLIGGATGRVIFIATLASVIVAANLRLHLWFTSRFYPEELTWLRTRVARWIQGADWLLVIALLGGGLLVGDDRSPLAILLLSFGVGAAVAFLFIEPATTRAAFRGRDPSQQI